MHVSRPPCFRTLGPRHSFFLSPMTRTLFLPADFTGLHAAPAGEADDFEEVFARPSARAFWLTRARATHKLPSPAAECLAPR